MYPLIAPFWLILRLQRGPQSLPASPLLLYLLLIGHAATGTLLALFSLPFAWALLSGLVGSIVMSAFFYLLLSLFRLQQRWQQTVIAVAGCELLLGTVALPLSALVFGQLIDPTLPALASLLLMVWNLVVVGHIIHHAINVNRQIGLLWAFTYTLLAITVSTLLLPGETP
jgi:hypothetical protein